MNQSILNEMLQTIGKKTWYDTHSKCSKWNDIRRKK